MKKSLAIVSVVLFSTLLLGQSPQSIAGLSFLIREYETVGDEELGPYERDGTFSETMVTSFEGEIQAYTTEPYVYTKTGENTGRIFVEQFDGDKLEALFTFQTPNSGIGTWEEDGGEDGFSGVDLNLISLSILMVTRVFMIKFLHHWYGFVQ